MAQKLSRKVILKSVKTAFGADIHNTLQHFIDDEDYDSDAIWEELNDMSNQDPNHYDLLEGFNDLNIKRKLFNHLKKLKDNGGIINNDNNDNNDIKNDDDDIKENKNNNSDNSFNIGGISFDFNNINGYMNERQINDTKKFYSKQYPDLCRWHDDKVLIHLLSIQRLSGYPLSMYLMDSFGRLNIDLKKKKLKTLDFNEWITGAVSQKKTKYTTFFKELSQTNKSKGILNHIKQGLTSYQKRTFQFYPKGFNTVKILDDYRDISLNIIDIIRFINELSKKKQYSTPFQMDFVILLNKTKMDKFGSDFDDSDGEFDDDNDSNNINDNAKYVKKNLENHLNNIFKYKQAKMPKNTKKSNRFWNELFDKLLLDTTNNNHYINKRHICYYDTRNGINKAYIVEPKYKGKLTGINNDFSRLPDYPRMPECYFGLSKDVIIPNPQYFNNDNTIKKHIGVKDDCDGTVMTFSFHVESETDIKCYLIWQSCIMRFLPPDLYDILPEYFEGINDTTMDAYKKEIKSQIITNNVKIRDDKFKTFCKRFIPETYNLGYDFM